MVAVTNATASSSDAELFDTRFSMGAAALAAISFLLAIVVGWTGYQGSELVVVGMDLDVVSGLAGFMLLFLVSVTSLVAAVYMEPGFDH
ncbi:hypothetical protein CYV19_15615 [Natronobacterium gregoryi SP2]|uniref:Uncharacterized protein n=1 Tax=Natronobacterium gregoryi (strain ATCC 43098 / DSM 3393 / CCM 3738 / CIP 104747 / IAM 13177 / JCM 8860 / NBRC 102187 / NCIMB 2189 / SP2) TaxID=797304 RepID=L9YGQ6_NATGS|nr:hypothetical protein C490_01822 [Natronobacterium gregoryi SP2]PLK19306.1 hypothetical protein CYV19_15615 [Natronobacterium gregoryi SP2]